MNTQEVILAIRAARTPRRDSLVDDLADAIEAEAVDPETAQAVVLELIGIARTETDPVVHESIMNLLSSYYSPSGDCGADIEAFVTQGRGEFATGSIMHVIAIVGESHLANRREILTEYLESDVGPIREAAQDYLADN
jgi:hypothetical protein